jgi:hypothetical protein
MKHLIKGVGAVKLALGLLILGAVVAAAAAHATLPDQAATGQDRAAAGGANGQDHAAAGPKGAPADQAQAVDIQAITDRLADNQDRVLSNLDEVVARLQDAGANQHAVDAVQAVIDRLTNENIGLNRASDAVSAHGAAAHGELPTAAADHPTPDNHPGRP